MLTDAVIEVRRALKCANIFLKYNSAVFHQSIKIIIKTNSISVINKFDVYAIDLNSIEVDLNSLSNLLVSECNVSFRVSLTEQTAFEDISNSNINADIKWKDKIKVQLQPNIQYDLVCKVCQIMLISSAVFKRVLELPSGAIDVGDFFCHNGPNLEKLLEPNENDVLYGLFHIVINTKKLSNVLEKNGISFCKRCMVYVGEYLYNNKAVKIWNESVYIKNENELTKLFPPKDLHEICCILLKNALDECDEISNLNSCQFSKILIESTFPDAHKKYLMLNIFEKSLEILTGSEPVMELESQTCMKIFFKIEIDKNQPLLQFWLKDLNTHSVTVSNTVFKYLTNDLIKNSELVPAIYRKHNGFLMSYFFYKK